MARYLNPAKIGLLVLIELYVEDAVPSDAILPVLSFLTSHIIDHEAADPVSAETSKWSKADRKFSLVIALKDFEKLLGSYPFLMGMPGRKLWDQFVGKLWDINSLDALNSFFENLISMLKKTKEEVRRIEQSGREVDEEEQGMKISRNSPFGIYVRRARVEYQRLRFNDCAELWKDFVRYRQPTVQYQRRKFPDLGTLGFDSVLLAGEQEDWDSDGAKNLASIIYGDLLTEDRMGKLPVSTHDVEGLLEFQIEQMQKFGSRIPIEVHNQFHDLLQDSFLVPSLTHYLTFLDSWRSGDYPTAFDYLHRYFDYTMHNRDRLFYQYALMNLAVLQADFGCHKEAVAAMLETVATARENKDMTCLNFALNWLFHFGRAHPDLVKDLESNSMLGTGKESLAYLRVKAKESGMWSLWSSVLLSEAKLGLTNGESVATAVEHMVRSSQLILEKNMKNMFGSQTALMMALWERLGVAQLSISACDVFLRCHAVNSMFDDELRLTCRLALILAERGSYDEALARLDSIDTNSLRSWKPAQYFHKYRGIIKTKRDLHHNNLDGASRYIQQLLQNKVDDLEPDMAFTIDCLQVDLLIRRNDLRAAFEQVQILISTAKSQRKDIALQIKLLLLKASLYNKSGRPRRGFSTAMRAASLSFRSRLICLLWQSLGAVCTILVSLREFEAAAEILVAIIPRTLECESSALSAELYSCLGDANMGLAGMTEAKSRERAEFMTRAAEAVQSSFDLFVLVEDAGKQCEMMAKKATVMKLAGEMERANDYAAAYVALKKQAERLRLGP